jgi:hypothetical protein
MNSDMNSLSMNMDIEKKKKKVKGSFVPDNYFFVLIGGWKHTLDRNHGEYCLIISTNFKLQLLFFLYYYFLYYYIIMKKYPFE